MVTGSLAYHCTVNGACRHGKAVALSLTRLTAPPSGSQMACRSPAHGPPSVTAATNRPIPAELSQVRGTELPATKDSRAKVPCGGR